MPIEPPRMYPPRMYPREMLGDAPNVDAVRCRVGRKMHSDLVGARKAVPCAQECSVHCLLRYMYMYIAVYIVR